MVVKHYNKNFVHVAEKGTQMYIKGIPLESLTHAKTRIGTLMGSFTRIKSNCSYDSLTITASLEYMFEIIVAYRWLLSWITNALYRLIHGKGEEFSYGEGAKSFSV